MFTPDDPRFAEMLELAVRASGQGLLDSQRPRWRELCTELLGHVMTRSGPGSERRKALRAAASLPVQLLEPAGAHALVASSVSSGGLAIPLEMPLPLGTPVLLSMQLDGMSAPVLVRGSVVWSEDETMGVMFTDLVQGERERLEAMAVRAVLAHVASE